MSSRFDCLPGSPFSRLARLLDGLTPRLQTIDLAVGEPKHKVPDFVAPIMAAKTAEFGRYPSGTGSPACRTAAAQWLRQRFSLGDSLDPDRNVLIVAGTREALFSVALTAMAAPDDGERPAVLMPNPFYQCYAAAAVAAGGEPVYLDATARTGFLPDLDALPDALLSRTALFYLCSPANPQGAVAGRDYLARAIALARAHDFVLLADECYSEIYSGEPPAGALEVAQGTEGGFDRVLVFNSLSKRSSLPGLRCGLCAGDERLIQAFAKFRNLAAPQVPMPIQAVAEAAWSDEAHVIANRDLYSEKQAMAERILAGRFGHYRPAGGFFLWLDVAKAGGGEQATRALWREQGLRVLPGAYLARDNTGGDNPAADYIRVALVHDLETTEMALNRMVEGLNG